MEEKLIMSKSIRKYCLWCCGDDPKEVRMCVSTNCPLWRYRLTKEVEAPGTRLPRGKAIKARCLDCSAGERKEVRKCTFTDCPLFQYRL